MNIAIADDDKRMLESARQMVEEFMDKRAIPADISTFNTPDSFIESLADTRYTLVIMDIYFIGEDKTGVDAIRALREKDLRSMVIFLTDSKDHMPDAFMVHAFSYVLKQEVQEMLPRALEDVLSSAPQSRSITVTHQKQQVMLPTDEIISIQTDGHYLVIRTIGGEEYRPRMTFFDMSRKLDKAKEFLLVNKGILVNMDHIKNFDNNNVLMTDGSSLPVRVRGYSNLVKEWHNYNFEKLRADRL